MRLAAGLAPLLAALMLAPAGAAKGGDASLELCGSSGCATAPPAEDERVWAVLELEYSSSPDDLVSAPPLAPYLDLRSSAEWLQAGRWYFVPSAGLVRTGGTWIRPDPELGAWLTKIAAGIQPWAAPAVARALVAGREIAQLEPYARLLGPLERAEWPELPGTRVEIALSFRGHTPWAGTSVVYYADHGLLNRDGDLLALPADLQRRIGEDAGISPIEPLTLPSGGDAASGWPALVILGGAVLAGFAALPLVLRTRP